MIPEFTNFDKIESFRHLILTDNSFLSKCIKKDIKFIFAIPSISSQIDILFNSSLEIDSFFWNPHDYDLDFDLFWYKKLVDQNLKLIIYPRYTPIFMFYAELISKLLTFVMLVICIINNSPNQYHNNMISNCLMVLLVTQILYEIGQLQELDFDLQEYFSQGWNILDFFSYILILIGLTSLFYGIDSYEYENIGYPFLSCASIPMSLSLFQFLIVFESVGHITIVLSSMIIDVIRILFVYFIFQFGFAVTLLGLHNQDIEFNNFGSSMLYLFSTMLGNFDFESFNSSNSTIKIISIILLVCFLVLTSIVLLNLIIAKMTNTFQKVDDKSKEEVLFLKSITTSNYLIKKESNVLCMLPAPLNIATILVFPLDYFYFFKRGRSFA